MPNQDIPSYIKQQRAAGVNDDAIKRAMLSSGWKEEQLQSAFSSGTTDEFGGRLLGPMELFSKSFSILKSRFWTLVGIQFLPVAIAFAVGLIVALGSIAGVALGLSWNIGTILAVVVVGIVFMIGAVYISLWSQVALFQAIINAGERIGFKEAFKRSRSKIGAFFWVSLLESLVVAGGFILLIIPGIIFAVWFIFANIIYMDEGTRGTAALAKSREYTRGIWGKIAGRMLAFSLIWIGIYIALGILSAFFKDGKIAANILTQALSVIMAPLFTIYAVLIYKNIKSIKGDVSIEGKGKGWISAVAFLGTFAFILPLTAAIVLVAINPKGQLEKAQDALIKQEIATIQQSLKSYKQDNNYYPNNLEMLVPVYIKEIPVEKLAGYEKYEYETAGNGKDYKLCVVYYSTTYADRCVTSTTHLEEAEKNPPSDLKKMWPLPFEQPNDI